MKFFIPLVMLVFITSLNEFKPFVTCDFTFTYEPDDFPMAIMNLSYVDPMTAVLRKEKTDIGRFGQGVLKDVSGVVVHVTSNNHTNHRACDRLDIDRIPQERYIALIKQGQCKDEIKLMNAADANASAVIMYGEYISTNFVRISYRVLQLPYIFIHPDKGQQLAALVDNGTRVFAAIGIDKRHNFRYASINRSSVLFVSISFIFLMILSMAWLVFYYVQKFRFVVSKDVRTKRLSSATLEALEKIPVKTMREKDFTDNSEVEYCAVCIEMLKTDDIVRILPCKHRYHKACVDPWLLEQRSCPMCKLDILMHFGITWYGSQESLWEFDDGSMHHRRSSVMQEVIHVVSSRRNSYSQTNPTTEDRGTSPFMFMPLNTRDDVVELSIDLNPTIHYTYNEEDEEDNESEYYQLTDNILSTADVITSTDESHIPAEESKEACSNKIGSD